MHESASLLLSPPPASIFTNGPSTHSSFLIYFVGAARSRFPLSSSQTYLFLLDFPFVSIIARSFADRAGRVPGTGGMEVAEGGRFLSAGDENDDVTRHFEAS